jgi:acylphosphatase
MPVRKRVVVSGRVQGVAFRNSTQMAAVALGVKGWVRNLPNGDVEGCFEGEPNAVQQLVDWCRRGPAAARVERLIEHDEGFIGEFRSFEIRY